MLFNNLTMLKPGPVNTIYCQVPQKQLCRNCNSCTVCVYFYYTAIKCFNIFVITKSFLQQHIWIEYSCHRVVFLCLHLIYTLSYLTCIYDYSLQSKFLIVLSQKNECESNIYYVGLCTYKIKCLLSGTKRSMLYQVWKKNY